MNTKSKKKKSLITVTVETEIYSDFKKICEENNIHMTTVLRDLILEEIKVRKFSVKKGKQL